MYSAIPPEKIGHRDINQKKTEKTECEHGLSRIGFGRQCWPPMMAINMPRRSLCRFLLLEITQGCCLLHSKFSFYTTYVFLLQYVA